MRILLNSYQHLINLTISFIEDILGKGVNHLSTYPYTLLLRQLIIFKY